MQRHGHPIPVGRWTIRRELHHPPHPFEARLSGKEDLLRWLQQLCDEGDANFHMKEEDTGDEITVLMKAPSSVVILNPGRGGDSWSASLDPRFYPKSAADWHEFELGSTPTPIPTDRCLPLETMRRVVVHFYEHGSRPDWISWRYD